MLEISADGMINDTRVKLKRYEEIEKGSMNLVAGIIVHQTGGVSAQSAFNSYVNGASGAHLLIDKDGTIYQTASLEQQTWHVGRIRSRCLAEKRCSPQENVLAQKWDPKSTHNREMKKSTPDRYPSNIDSIGIEIVGQALPMTEPDPDRRTYETLTDEQAKSLKWLVAELCAVLGISPSEIFRHPTVSYKNATEAAAASW